MTEKSDLYAAIVAAAGDMKRVSKDNRNAEQKYDFASVDDFFAMTGPVCAKHGLVVMADETGCDPFERVGKYGPTQWLALTYSVVIIHASGQSTAPVTRHVEVIRTGPQSFGSGQSYVLKQFLRGIFQIPTGDDDDPDNGKTTERDQDRPQRDDREPERRQEAPPQSHEEAVQSAVAALGTCNTLAELQATWGRVKAVQTDPRVIEAKDKRKAAINDPAFIPY